MHKKTPVILLFFSAAVILFAFLVFPKLDGIEVQQQKQNEKSSLIENLESKPQSYFSKLSVTFAEDNGCEPQPVLRVKANDIQNESILAITLIPEIDGTDLGTDFSKPMPSSGYLELNGLPVVCTIKSPSGKWDICYPSFVFDRDTYLPPDNRDITGWIVQVYLTDSIAASPLNERRTSGKLQILTKDDLSDGLHLLGTQFEKEQFSSSNIEVIAIPNSDSGVLFYIDEKALIASIKKKFNRNMQERETD